MATRFKQVITISLCLVCIIFFYGLGGLAGMHMPENVERSSKFAYSIIRLLPMTGSACATGDRTACGYNKTEDKHEVSCAPFKKQEDRQAVIFAFGQSNSANYGQVPYYPLNNNIVNFNPHDGKCYKAEGPMLGPDGTKGSVWPVMADQLIQSGAYDRVLINSYGIGGTEIERWAPGGDLHVRVEHAANQLVEKNIIPTHVLWHQGESDAMLETLEEDYKRMFSDMISALRSYGIEAPVYPAVATICEQYQSDQIQNAQRALPTEIDNVLPGPDTDALFDPSYRHDGCHFSQIGLRAHAKLWVDAISDKKVVVTQVNAD